MFDRLIMMGKLRTHRTLRKIADFYTLPQQERDQIENGV